MKDSNIDHSSSSILNSAMNMRKHVVSTLRIYEGTNDKKSMGILVFALTAYVIFLFASISSYTIHPWLPAIFWIPLAFVISRLLVLEHDCGHRTLFTKPSHNFWTGTVLGFLTLIPSRLWNHIHNTHHGLVGNLSKRNINPELWTLTVNEYRKASPGKKIAYRIVRSYFMRLVISPMLWIFAPRIPFPQLGKKIITSILAHNLIYGIGLYLIITNELFTAFIMVYLVPLYIFNLLASIFLYLQHQFDGAMWEHEKEWDFYTGSIHGSSHLVVGKIMAWVSGNVGCHYAHHLNTRIPFYNLQNATADVNQYLDIKPIYLKELFHHINFVLWDEDSKKMVPIRSISK